MNIDYWDEAVVVATTLGLVGLCVVIHAEGLDFLRRLLGHLHTRVRFRMALLIVGILIMHVVEIWIFGAGYYLLLLNPAFGTLEGLAHLTLLDSVYFSSMVYTTVGFGDLIPHDDIRFLTGVEALTGLVLITWSASFTYLEMQRRWKD